MGIKSQRIIFIFLVIVVVAFSLLKKPFGNPDEGAHQGKFMNMPVFTGFVV